jgi:aerobic-type carbon monoxide dehydrogenase small subunit (CoxS/CutS family)
MAENAKKDNVSKISRREFLKDAGLVVGGATIGSMSILSACKGDGTTSTVTDTKTVTNTVTNTTTATATTTVVQPDNNSEDLTTLTINGNEYKLELEPTWSLLYVIREKLGLVGTKRGCDRGECGTCTVIMDGRAVFSCMTLAVEAVGKDITTVEGIGSHNLNALQQTFVDHNAIQCGFCVPGFLMTATALLNENPDPTYDEVREGLSGHICVCGNGKRMVEAVMLAKGGAQNG